MKKGLIWKILLLVGICPFVVPFGAFLWQMVISESWTLADWLIMYSFVYWPTYVAGLILIVVSILMLKKSN